MATQFILFAGRLHPQKYPILLVRAIAALADLNVHLLIAGDGVAGQYHFGCADARMRGL